ncbi:hypothetical protein T4D_2618 [Trichinella pseudospiralis]|uniref:Uncharacterized protein n=1 Tax=Trichinella pseudospiralis TaxID=6337 RepID=A0A0V1FF27_TRIPS|nr:hypothetical protein T4D_2618 [Trichinella pseudospiralis]
MRIPYLEERMGGAVLLVSTTNNYACWAMSLALAHSGQRMSGPSVMKPWPTSDISHWAHLKQSLCQWRSSNEMNLVPPMAVIGLVHSMQRLANSSPKQSAQ